MSIRRALNRADTLSVRHVKHLAALYLLICFGSMIAGCGGSGDNPTTVVTAPVILVQPQSQEVPIGLGAVFSVQASGGELNYSWTVNGAPVPNASNSSYTVAPVELSNTNSVVVVTVSNSAGSVVSNRAVLTAGARAPNAGDLRFQNVDAEYVNQGTYGIIATAVLANSTNAYSNVVASPLQIGSGICSATVSTGCGWYYAVDGSLSGLISPNASYITGNEPDFQASLGRVHTTS